MLPSCSLLDLWGGFLEVVSRSRWSRGVAGFAFADGPPSQSHDKQRVRTMMLLLKKLLDANGQLIDLLKSKLLIDIKETETETKPSVDG